MKVKIIVIAIIIVAIGVFSYNALNDNPEVRKAPYPNKYQNDKELNKREKDSTREQLKRIRF